MFANKLSSSIRRATMIVLVLLMGIAACGNPSNQTQTGGSQSTPIPTQPTPTPTPQPPPFTLIPLALHLTGEGADPGWQNLSVEVGVRNDGSTPQAIQFPDNGTVSIKEGNSYNVRL